MAGRARTKGVYTPLAAQYYLDDAILEAGPDAELMWVRILSFLASVPTDGFITERQVRSVGHGLRGVPKRVSRLQEVGLLSAEPGGFSARSWLKWNKSVQEYGRTLAQDRERKARNSGEDAPFSERNPHGTRPESDASTEQNSTEQTTPKGVVPRNRGTRIPDPFIVNADMRQWASTEVPAVDVDKATRVFVDYWRSASGRTATKRDWIAAWRNWLRRDSDSVRPGKPNKDERLVGVLELGARLQAQADRKELE